MKILLIEDDCRMADFVIRGLGELGHFVDHFTSGADGMIAAAGQTYGLLIVDRMLPGMDGINIVKMLRQTENSAPIIFLTALGETDDRIEGLNAGADDYLVKPFVFAELLARINALMRRPQVSEKKTSLKVGELEVDLLKRTATRQGKLIALQAQEFRLLEFLMRHEGRVVTRTMLLENVWDFYFDPKTSLIETHISRLRAKIDRDFPEGLLKTIRGVGYCLRGTA